MRITIKNPKNLKTHSMWFPWTDNEFEQVCKDLDIEISTDENCIIEDTNNTRLNPIFQHKSVNVDEFDYLLKRLDSLDENELDTFYALQSANKTSSLKDLINFTFNTHCYSVVNDFSNLDKLGKRLILTERGGMSLAEYNDFDGAEYFKTVVQNNPKPAVTPYGILYPNNNEYENVYDGKTFPYYEFDDNIGVITLNKDEKLEYVYLPSNQTKLDKALNRLSATSVDECKVCISGCTLLKKLEPQSSPSELITLSEKLTNNDILKPMEEIIDILKPSTVDEVSEILDSVFEFEVLENIHTAYDYGRHIIINSGHFEYDENLEPYIDFKKYGEEKILFDDGVFTDFGYVAYHGYNENLAPLLQNMGIEFKPIQTQTLKLYMPLTTITYDDCDDTIDISPRELVDYKDEILKALENNALPSKRGLMEYYAENNSVKAKVKRYDFSVENVGGKLMGVAILELNSKLTDKELKLIKEDITCQSADGFGEGFEQRAIKTNDNREIYLSFWNNENWSLQTAEELGVDRQTKKLELGGMQM